MKGVQPHPSLRIRDCALIAIATGKRAQSLKELREHLLTVGPSSIYFHFWGGLLRPGFEEREYNNDFAAWTRHALHDKTLAERLAVLDPTRFSDLEALRQELIELVDERMDETEALTWAKSDEQFEFIRSQVVVFRTSHLLTRPEQLPEIVPQLSTGSVFYHFIDARRRRDDGVDDFRFWLSEFGHSYDDLRSLLVAIDPYFVPLTELRSQLSDAIRDYFRGKPHEQPA